MFVISTIVAIMVAVVIYALMLVITKTVTEDELLSMPKGAMIAKLMKKIHMI